MTASALSTAPAVPAAALRDGGFGGSDTDPIQGRVLDAVVVGAGVAGLSAAWDLQKAGLTCAVLESAARIGGKVGTHDQDGYRFEAGPNTVYLRDKNLIDLVAELGGADRWTIADPRAKKRFLAIDGRLKKLPAGPLSFACSSILSPLEKLRMVSEPFRAKGPARDESVGDFIRRRLGDGALINLVAPFVSGIYAGNPERLEAASVFPSLVDAEQRKGSLVRGLLSGGARTPKDRKVALDARLRSLTGGMRTLAELFAAKLSTPVRLNTAVTHLTRNDSYYRLTTQTGEVFRARQVILATPVAAAARLLAGWPGAAELAAELAGIETCKISVVSVGLREEQLTRPQTGFGYLTVRRPGCTPNPVLGCLWPSCMFPDRAPQGHRLITLYIGGALHPEAFDLTEGQLRDLTRAELSRTLGFTGDFDLFFVERWERAIPQYTLGHARRLDRIRSALAVLPSLALAGNYLTGVSVAQAIDSGREAASACLKEAKVNP